MAKKSSTKKEISQEKLLECRDLIEQGKYKEAYKFGIKNNIPFGVKDEPKRNPKNKCNFGEDVDHIIPASCLEKDLGEINERCLNSSENRNSKHEKEFKKWLRENH